MAKYMAIDSHVHLWEEEHGTINDKPVFSIGNGKVNFGGEIRQMMPPYMEDNKNTVERLIANMDYAQVSGAVVTQEYIDGNQDEYLLECKRKYPKRIKIFSLYEENDDYRLDGFDGLKICAAKFKNKDLKRLLPVFKKVEEAGKILAIELFDGDSQVADMQYLIEKCPNLKITIGHFGMVTTKGWQKQISLACNKNVYIESGGLTWLFHKEFYPYNGAIDAILEAKDICGMDKLMWGSDYPRTMTDISYIMALRFIEETDKLTDEEKAAFLGKNAEKFYGFNEMKLLDEIVNML